MLVENYILCDEIYVLQTEYFLEEKTYNELPRMVQVYYGDMGVKIVWAELAW